MPGWEGTVIQDREETKSAVRTELRMTYGTGRVEGVYSFSKSAIFLIEGNAHQGIFQIFQILDGQFLLVGCTVVDVFAVGRKGGKSLQTATVACQW